MVLFHLLTSVHLIHLSRKVNQSHVFLSPGQKGIGDEAMSGRAAAMIGETEGLEVGVGEVVEEVEGILYLHAGHVPALRKGIVSGVEAVPGI